MMKAPLALTLLAALSGFCAPAAAQEMRPQPRTRGVEVAPAERLAGVDLQVRLSRPSGVRAGPGFSGAPVFREHELMLVCVTASKSGFLTLWSQSDSKPTPERLYPNDYVPAMRAQMGGPVIAGQERCFGGGEEGFRLKVTGPYEMAQIYAHWTATAESQFGFEEIPMVRVAAGKGLAMVKPYASTTVPYQITP